MADDPPKTPHRSGLLKAEDRRGKMEKRYAEDYEPRDKTETETAKAPGRARPWDARAILGVMIFLATVFAASLIFSYLSKNNETPQKAPAATAPSVNFLEKSSSAEVTRMTEEVVRGFMDAADVEEASRYLLNGDQKIEQLQQYLTRPGGVMPAGFGKIIKVMPMAFGGVPMRSVIASDAKGKNGWILILAPTQDGLVIDWEATVAYGDLTWGQFIRLRPTTPTLMRVYLIRQNYQPGLPEEAEHDFYRIEARREKWSVPSFVKMDSVTGTQLRRCVPPSGSQPVTVRLQWNEAREVVEIVELVHNYWVNLAEYPMQSEHAEKQLVESENKD